MRGAGAAAGAAVPFPLPFAWPFAFLDRGEETAGVEAEFLTALMDILGGGAAAVAALGLVGAGMGSGVRFLWLAVGANKGEEKPVDCFCVSMPNFLP